MEKIKTEEEEQKSRCPEFSEMHRYPINK